MTTFTLSPCGLASLLSVLSPRWIASRSTAGVMRREVPPRQLENLPSVICNQRLEDSRLLFIPLALFVLVTLSVPSSNPKLTVLCNCVLHLDFCFCLLFPLLISRAFEASVLFISVDSPSCRG
jgi:hypothetical protein